VQSWTNDRDGLLRSVRGKILGVVAVCVLFAGAIGIYAAVEERRLGDESSQLIDRQVKVTRALNAMQDSLWKVRMQSYVVEAWSGTDKDQQDDKYDDNTAAFESATANVGTVYAAAFGHQPRKLAAVKAAWQVYVDQARREVIPAAMSGDHKRYMHALLEGDPGDNGGAIAKGTALVGQVDQLHNEVAGDLDDEVATMRSSIDRAVTTTVLLMVIGLLVGTAAGWIIARRIRAAAVGVRSSLTAMAAGDLTVSTKVNSNDELGQMAAALSAAQENLRGLMSGIADAAHTVAASAEELSVGSAQAAADAEAASGRAVNAAAAAEQVSHNVQSVASGAEQMGASIREIAQNASEAARVASQATVAAAETNEQVSRLGDSSQEIGNVVRLITSIAEQTNLLALNATIEAARAGDAGKGFAVVAGEVQELARETAKATEDIVRRVDSIQADTSNAVVAIGQITQTVSQINDFQMTIASAVEEQTATTNDITRSVTEAATGSGEIAQHVTDVATTTSQSSSTLSQMGAAVDDLAKLAADLRLRVAAFSY
jgi:methyl-accepting chemotaxis protein